jgi:hypothetical protein
MHCGWCIIFLQILNLPLCKPSSGNFNLAVNLGYPLADPIRESPQHLGQNPCIISWDHFINLNKELLGEIWKFVFKSIYGDLKG